MLFAPVSAPRISSRACDMGFLWANTGRDDMPKTCNNLLIYQACAWSLVTWWFHAWEVLSLRSSRKHSKVLCIN